jgi:uncharacterized membrane protein
MTLLVAGLLLFTGSHLFMAVGVGELDSLRQRLGAGPVKGLLAVLIGGGLALMVIGWRASEVLWLYALPPVVQTVAFVLIASGIYLMVVAGRASRVKRVLRHPQLTGVLLWAIAHLLLNGDLRSAVLFGGLALWCVLEILLINRRDGPWIRPEAPPLATDAVTAVIAVLVLGALVWAHPWLAGVPLYVG